MLNIILRFICLFGWFLVHSLFFLCLDLLSIVGKNTLRKDSFGLQSEQLEGSGT